MNKLKKFIKNIIDNFFYWIIKYRYQLTIYLIITPLLVSVSFLPYFNLFIGRDLLIFILLILFFILFRINYKKIFIMGLIFFLLALPFYVSEEFEIAENIANFTYGILFTGLMKYIFDENL